jgi:AraC family transcriptional regulator
MRRISVIRNEKIVPLFPSKPINSKLRSPVSGLIIETHALGAIELPAHEHSSYCLSLHLGDPIEQEWWSGGRNGIESYRTGSMSLISPGTHHRTYMNRPSRLLILSFEESHLLRAAREIGKSRVTVASRLRFEDHQLHLLMSEFQREMESGWETGTLYQEHLGFLFSIALIQKFNEGTAALPIVKGGMTRVRLQRVLDYIAANNHRDITLTDLAEVADLSRFHFARLFRLQMGTTPHRYLIDRRLERAKALLRHDTSLVTDIALETGFRSNGHFSRAFRRYVGVSPTEWKRKA